MSFILPDPFCMFEGSSAAIPSQSSLQQQSPGSPNSCSSHNESDSETKLSTQGDSDYSDEGHCLSDAPSNESETIVRRKINFDSDSSDKKFNKDNDIDHLSEDSDTNANIFSVTDENEDLLSSTIDGVSTVITTANDAVANGISTAAEGVSTGLTTVLDGAVQMLLPNPHSSILSDTEANTSDSITSNSESGSETQSDYDSNSNSDSMDPENYSHSDSDGNTGSEKEDSGSDEDSSSDIDWGELTMRDLEEIIESIMSGEFQNENQNDLDSEQEPQIEITEISSDTETTVGSRTTSKSSSKSVFTGIQIEPAKSNKTVNDIRRLHSKESIYQRCKNAAAGRTGNSVITPNKKSVFQDPNDSFVRKYGGRLLGGADGAEGSKTLSKDSTKQAAKLEINPKRSKEEVDTARNNVDTTSNNVDAASSSCVNVNDSSSTSSSDINSAAAVQPSTDDAAASSSDEPVTGPAEPILEGEHSMDPGNQNHWNNRNQNYNNPNYHNQNFNPNMGHPMGPGNIPMGQGNIPVARNLYYSSSNTGRSDNLNYNGNSINGNFSPQNPQLQGGLMTPSPINYYGQPPSSSSSAVNNNSAFHFVEPDRSTAFSFIESDISRLSPTGRRSPNRRREPDGNAASGTSPGNRSRNSRQSQQRVPPTDRTARGIYTFNQFIGSGDSVINRNSNYNNDFPEHPPIPSAEPSATEEEQESALQDSNLNTKEISLDTGIGSIADAVRDKLRS